MTYKTLKTMVACDKYIIFLAFLVFGTIGIIWLNLSNLNWRKQYKTFAEIPDDKIKFNAYLKRFNKSYSGDEYLRRLEYFKQSLEELSLLNAYNITGARHGLTKFSDLSKEEFSKMMDNPAYVSECKNLAVKCKRWLNYILVFKSTSFSYFYSYYHRKVVPNAFDWRDHNVIGPVLDQKKCMACWAFGIIGLIESMEAIQGLQSYTQRSVQELLDCSLYDNTCKGGHVNSALYYLCSRSLGIITQEEYPLKLIKGSCDWTPIEKYIYDGRRVSQYGTICNMNESDILRQIYYHGPVIAVVNADPWRHYTGGVIHRACYRSPAGDSVDHVVQIVGYNLNADPPHYIIKNSWGEDFGEDGYVRVAIGGNVCGISDEITYLDVK